jgi:T5SS/PEP-CTERM-associated repeat protein
MNNKKSGWCFSMAVIAVMFQCVVPVQAAVYKNFNVISGYWTNSANWAAPGVPGSGEYAYVGSDDGASSATCIVDTAGPLCYRLYVGNDAGNDGTVSITAGVLTNENYLYIGYNGNGTVNLSGSAELRVIAGRAYVGNSAGSTGVVNQTGGIWDMGANSSSYLTMGQNAGSYGECNISGGGLTNVYKLYVASSGTGLLSIVGSEASIHVEELRSSTANSTLRVTPDSGGISPINVLNGALGGGKVYLAGTLDVDFSNYDSTDDLTIIKHDGALSTTFATITMTTGWTADVTYASGEVRITNIIRPPQGTVLLVN